MIQRGKLVVGDRQGNDVIDAEGLGADHAIVQVLGAAALIALRAARLGWLVAFFRARLAGAVAPAFAAIVAESHGVYASQPLSLLGRNTLRRLVTTLAEPP